MLRLRDARTGEWHDFPGRAPARLHVCGSGPRGLLVADMLRRAATVLHGREPMVTSSEPDGGGLAAWNIHPPAATAATVESADVVIGCRDGGRCALEVGPLAIEADHADPLVLRLAALEFPYPQPARLDATRVEAAADALAGWRAAMSAWATAPGAAMSRPHAVRMAAALDDDLATPLALQVLRELQGDETVSAGAKFETFAYVDRLLGLDLARDIGRQWSAPN